MGVYGDWLAFGASLKWPFEELQFSALNSSDVYVATWVSDIYIRLGVLKEATALYPASTYISLLWALAVLNPSTVLVPLQLK